MGGRLRIRMVKNGRIAGAFRAEAVIFTPLPTILLTLGLTHILAAIVRPGRGLRALLRLLLLLLGRRLISGLGAVGFGDSGRAFDLHLGDAHSGETCVELSSVPWEDFTAETSGPRGPYRAREDKGWKLEPGRCGDA